MQRYSIGREEGNDIVINDPSVSRRHAEIIDTGTGTYKLVDSGSSNGTWCLGDAGWEQVMSAELDADALIRIGSHDTSVFTLLTAVGITPVRSGHDVTTRPIRKR